MLHKKLILVMYCIVLLSLTIYSYCLIDPNLTIVNHPMWIRFRDPLVYFGYYQRAYSWYSYLAIVTIMFFLHIIMVRKHSVFNPLKIAIFTGSILLFAYPFLSHDMFNYMFDARIFTYYHQNPYLQKALDFPGDPWLRFMHWTHRSYPYGPVFLPITLVPAFLSFGKFITHFFLYKLMMCLFYVGCVRLLAKMNNKWGMFFATQPFILIEGVINVHNDLIAVFFALIGVSCLLSKKKHWGKVMLLASAGIKYMTAPTILLRRDKKHVLNKLAFIAELLILVYLTYTSEVQPWYFLLLFLFIPYYFDLIDHLYIFFAALTLSYYPFIMFGSWDLIWIKHILIVGGLILACGNLYREYFYKKKFFKM